MRTLNSGVHACAILCRRRVSLSECENECELTTFNAFTPEYFAKFEFRLDEVTLVEPGVFSICFT